MCEVKCLNPKCEIEKVVGVCVESLSRNGQY